MRYVLTEGITLTIHTVHLSQEDIFEAPCQVQDCNEVKFVLFKCSYNQCRAHIFLYTQCAHCSISSIRHFRAIFITFLILITFLT